jgi:hypothetical protein
MYRYGQSIYLVVIALVTLTACVAPPPGATPAAEKVVTAPPAEKQSNSCPDEWPKPELCPEEMPRESLVPLKFTVPEKKGEFWLSEAPYVNSDKEAFSIQVVGASEKGVLEYVGSEKEPVLACFDMIVRTDCSAAAIELEEMVPEEQLKGDDVAIWIQPQVKEGFEEAFFLTYVMDPRISGGVTHYYSKKTGTRAYVGVAVKRAAGGEGSVSAGLCRNSTVPLKTTTVTAGATESGSVQDEPKTGKSYPYTAGVRGVDSLSRYRISNTAGWVGWYAGYYDTSGWSTTPTCRP